MPSHLPRRKVIVGVDTHKDQHVAVAIDGEPRGGDGLVGPLLDAVDLVLLECAEAA